MNLLKIKPYDNTFFRGGNNFNFEMSNLIQSRNIAYPSTFFGAIFTAILSQNDNFRNEFFKKKYNNDHLKILKINQIYLYNEKQNLVYISAPKDIFIGNGIIKYGTFVKADQNTISIPYSYYLEEPNGNELERADKYFVTIENFYKNYYYKNFSYYSLKSEDEIFAKNLKTGISLDQSTGVVEESYIYTIEQTEFRNFKENDWSYIVEYEIKHEALKKERYKSEIKDLDRGDLKLGGESKICSYKKIQNKDIENFRKNNPFKNIESAKMIKVILTSDSYFEKDINKVFEDKMKLVGLVNDKPIYIGGFDMAENKAKKMYKGYPAGTVLLLEILEKNEKNNTEDKLDIHSYLKEKIKGSKVDGFNEYIYMGVEL